MHTAMVVPSPRFRPTKDALRADALRARRAYARALSSSARDELARGLMGIVLSHVEAGACVAGYYPFRDEIDPTPLLDALGARGCAVALPWFATETAPMMFRRAPASARGPWGTIQPDASAPVVRPDVVFVPLVAVDRAGNRIGHGQGHYDRALERLRSEGTVRTIGLAWDVQLLDDAIPADAWDVPMDAVATPTRWIERN